MADGLLSPDDMMLMDAGLLFDPALVDAYTPTSDAMAIPETAAMMMPLSGLMEMGGGMPDPYGEGYLPSFYDLASEGDIEGIGYQLLGAGGDVLYAASPLIPPLAIPAAAAKTARYGALLKEASKLPDLKSGSNYKARLKTAKSPEIELQVGEKIDNLDSIDATLENYEEVQGVKELPLTAFPRRKPSELFYSPDDIKRTKKLAEDISSNNRIDPIIAVQDKEGYYILEGAHRVGAMESLGAKTIPAKIVVDLDNPPFEHLLNPNVNITKGSEAEKALQQEALEAGRVEASGLLDYQDFGGQTKNDIPFSEYEYEVTKTQDFDDSLLFDPQEYVGRTLKLMPSDITRAGYQLDSVLGQKLTSPTLLQGGFEFPVANPDLAWASEANVISQLASEASKNEGLLGVTSAMGGRSNDFSHHVTQTLVDLTRQNISKIDPKVVKKFDDEVRSKIKKDAKSEWLGIMNPETDKFLWSLGDDRLSGDIRKAIANIMDKAEYRDAGFPVVGAVRYAVTHPRFQKAVTDSTGSLNPTGARVVELPSDPIVRGVNRNAPMSHITFTSDIQGTNKGTMLTPIPRKFFFPDFFERRGLLNASPVGSRRSAEISNVTQLMTPKVADDISNYDYYYKQGLLGK